MPRPRKSVPDYLHHKPSGRAYCRVPKAGGGRVTRYLGLYGSPENRREYARVVAELEAGTIPVAAPSQVLVEDLVERFLTWARSHYRRSDGTVTQEADEVVRSTAPLIDLYGEVPVSEIGPLALKAVRGAMVKAGWCRKVVNKRIGRVKRCFKWGASEELVPIAVVQSLATVQGLQRGRTEARETDPVKPVAEDVVEATLAKLQPEVADMVRVQRLGAMRPQDICNLRPCDIDRSGEVWVYRPDQHKGQWRGKGRDILLGPRAQAILLPHLDGIRDDEHVFSPARTVRQWRARMRAARVSKVQPSQVARKKRKPKRQPGQKYTASRYATAIADAALAAGVPNWSPNQLRHAAATEIRERYGMEAAQVALGHERLTTTQIYAERNGKLGVKVAKEVG